jgi:molybdopterin synthase catalytic subunit
MTQPIRVLLFGALRDRAGRGSVSVDGTAASTVSELWSVVAADHALTVADVSSLRCARNLEYCAWDAAVLPGDEVAFMPPVCGGAEGEDSRVVVAIAAEPIAVDQLLADAGDTRDGAVACFIGRVRNHNDGERVSALEYEVYEPMAVVVMRRIAADARRRHQLSSVTVVHRTGALAVGDVAVVVITSSTHRDAALRACHEVIDAVKAEAPIWKREHTERGARWVDARHLDGAHV